MLLTSACFAGEAMTSIFDAIMKFQFDKKGTPGVVKVLIISECL